MELGLQKKKWKMELRLQFAIAAGENSKVAVIKGLHPWKITYENPRQEKV
jgi:hypothetical protein